MALPSFDLAAAVQAFITVFPAELPDKSMFASMALATRFSKPRSVWLGAAGAFALHSVLAAAVGGFVSRLPMRPVAATAGALFATGSVLMLKQARSHVRAEAVAPDSGSTSTLAVIASSFMLLGVAEIGDLTQFAMAGLAARTGEPLSVGLGGWVALCSVAALAVSSGKWLTSRVQVATTQLVGAAVFAALALWSFAETLS